ncbi:hypothetical protein MOKP64_44970 [Mycobacterium avium subsp. hominissuis]
MEQPPENAEHSAGQDGPGDELVSRERSDERPVEFNLSEDQPVPEAPLPIEADPLGRHRQRFQTMTFLTVAVLIGVVTLSTLLAAAIAPDAGALAGEIAKSSLPALITLLSAAITWAFRSEGK